MTTSAQPYSKAERWGLYSVLKQIACQLAYPERAVIERTAETLEVLEAGIPDDPFTQADVAALRSAYDALECEQSGKPSTETLRLLSLAGRIESLLTHSPTFKPIDVALLRDTAKLSARDYGETSVTASLRDLADRIEALLPPGS